MTATPLSARSSIMSGRLDALAYALLAVLPLGMALLNRSAQPLVAAAAIAALAARAQAGELPAVRARIAGLLSSQIGWGALAALAFAAVSVGWSHHPRTSAGALAEVAAASGVALVLHAALPGRLPAWVLKLATIAIALGCLTIVAELATGLAVRVELGGRPQTFIFKRSVAAMLIVAWPVAALLWLSARRSLAVALGLLLAVATFAAHSSATALGAAVGVGALVMTLTSRLLVSRALAVALVAAFLVAPVLGDAADRLIPARLVEKLDFAHARERIEVWQSFGEVVRRRPILGVGFGTSPVMAREPVAAEVPEARRLMLGAWHPHNGYLQVWAEMGLIGVLFAGATSVLVALRLRRADRARAAVAAAILGSAAAIMLVGHGAWQGWWATVLGAAAIWVARFPRGLASDPDPVRPARP